MSDRDLNIKRMHKVRTALAERSLDVLLVSSLVNLRYLSGFDGSAGALMIAGDESWLLTDFRYVEEVERTVRSAVLKPVRQDILSGVAELVRAERWKRVGFESRAMTVEQHGKLQDALPGIELVPSADLVESLRLIKDETEIRLIARAAAITDKVYAEVARLIAPGLTEKELALEIVHRIRSKGADKTSFDPIVLAGRRTSLVHGKPSRKKMGPGQAVLLDIGAVWNGYCSDLTRTVGPADADSRFRERYRLVLAAHQAVLAEIGPGKSARDMDKIARDIITDAGYGDRFGHGLGHGVGLEVHEGPRLSQWSDDRLAEGMVVTVEPGIYIPGWGGIRIEDLVLIVPQGYRPLSRSPRRLVGIL